MPHKKYSNYNEVSSELNKERYKNRATHKLDIGKVVLMLLKNQSINIQCRIWNLKKCGEIKRKDKKLWKKFLLVLNIMNKVNYEYRLSMGRRISPKNN